MSACRWCHGTGKYYPLVGEPSPCQECQTASPREKDITHALSQVIGITTSAMKAGDLGYIWVRGGDPRMKRAVIAKTDLDIGTLVWPDDVEIDMGRCTPKK